jgi:hypothetical protein
MVVVMVVIIVVLGGGRGLGYSLECWDSCLMEYLLNDEGITLSIQNFVEVLFLVLICNCLLKLYALLAIITHSKY